MITLQGGGKCDSIQMCDHRCVDTQPELCTAQNVTEVEREEMEDPGTRAGVNPWKVIQANNSPVIINWTYLILKCWQNF